MEWIVCYHSGPLKVVEWTAEDVVTHANTFARNVLLSRTGYNASADGTLAGAPLSVTPGFVQQWKLQSAVAARILRVE
ncbi:hypothetical protein RhiJN_18268 [Ceratobasidium sp. AG-Ba]|nr:hypothetical protein RhiJN_18268 [Ceratobasidium sp. AG-Ba]